MRRNLAFLVYALFFCSFSFYASAKTQLTISVFEDHERYTIASNAYGLSWEILSKAANQAGYTLVPLEISWPASLERLKAHKIDLVWGALMTEERKQWAEFTLTLMTHGSGIFTHLDNPVTSIDEIDKVNSIIGVSSKSLQEKFASEVGFENIYSSVRRDQLYKMLRQKRINYLFFGIGVIQYYCLYIDGSKTKDCLKQVGPAFKPDKLHAIAAKSNTEMVTAVARINEAILKIGALDSTERLFLERGFTQLQYQNWLAAIRAPQ